MKNVGLTDRIITFIMNRLLFTFLLISFHTIMFAQHPVCLTIEEANAVNAGISQYPLVTESFSEIKYEVDKWVGKDIDVPFPKDPAGGYSHDKHKANYTLMYNSGILYQITGDVKYAKLVKDLFLKYAILNPTLNNHPQATSSFPGRLFWQALNDANWLVYTGLAFDCIHNYLTPEERKTIEIGAFKPEVDFFTHNLKSWFNLIHNHAVWACAGVGIVGIATDNKDYIDVALKGTEKDGKAGFLAQMSGLFSPDGYYNEGPYYTRYAILPFYVFANALNNIRPELKIFEYRNSILRKALVAALQQTNIDGAFYSYNDALKEKNFVSNEIVEALDIAWKVYGKDAGLLTVAKLQNRVTLTAGGVAIAKELVSNNKINQYYPYSSVEYTDGANGDKGGVSILRAGTGVNITSLIFKYSSQGMSHGHFDKLNINLYDNGHEIIQDYGAVRYVNIEQKWGGRYLPETKAFAQQTIAHNTIAVDETSHFNGEESIGEKYHPNKLFSSVGNAAVQVVSVIDDKAYNNVKMQRTIYMLQLPDNSKPLIVDLFNVKSPNTHQYDLPFNYLGTLMSVNTKYTSFTKNQTPLGTKNGYQFYWKEAEAKASIPLSEFTFMNNNTFYSISSLTDESSKLFFARVGANDPDFNLRRDPAYLIRETGNNKTFVNVIETHGNFNPVSELSTGSYAAVQKIVLAPIDNNFTCLNIVINKKNIWIIQHNQNFDANESHSIKINDKTILFKGPYTVVYENEKL